MVSMWTVHFADDGSDVMAGNGWAMQKNMSTCLRLLDSFDVRRAARAPRREGLRRIPSLRRGTLSSRHSQRLSVHHKTASYHLSTRCSRLASGPLGLEHDIVAADGVPDIFAADGVPDGTVHRSRSVDEGLHGTACPCPHLGLVRGGCRHRLDTSRLLGYQQGRPRGEIWTGKSLYRHLYRRRRRLYHIGTFHCGTFRCTRRRF